MNIPPAVTERRSFADHLDDLRSRQQSVASTTRALLIRQGWRRTRMNLAHLWLWSKKLADGRALLTDLNTALSIECALAHQALPGPLPGPLNQPLVAPDRRN
jgi:hypothetical protein